MNKIRKATTIIGPAFAFAIIATAAIGFAYAASGPARELPEEMQAPPKRPVGDELLASVPNVPTPRPESAGGLSDKQDAGRMPEEELACRANLLSMGVKFEAVPDIRDEGECGIAFPIEVTSLGSGVELTPAGIMNCATAETAAQLVLETIKPAAKRTLGSDLAGIRHASAYICRNRASEAKISEHARGNALDISAFLLEDGRAVDVVGYGPANKPERRFMQTVRRAACGPFKTVLGPGTDADHAEHFHFDLAERRPGSTYCR
jgi:hypothetical protein